MDRKLEAEKRSILPEHREVPAPVGYLVCWVPEDHADVTRWINGHGIVESHSSLSRPFEAHIPIAEVHEYRAACAIAWELSKNPPFVVQLLGLAGNTQEPFHALYASVSSDALSRLKARVKNILGEDPQKARLSLLHGNLSASDIEGLIMTPLPQGFSTLVISQVGVMGITRAGQVTMKMKYPLSSTA